MFAVLKWGKLPAGRQGGLSSLPFSYSHGLLPYAG